MSRDAEQPQDYITQEETSISEMGAGITLLNIRPFMDPDDPLAYNGIWANDGNGRPNQRATRKDTAPSAHTVTFTYPIKMDVR